MGRKIVHATENKKEKKTPKDIFGGGEWGCFQRNLIMNFLGLEIHCF